MRLVTLEEAVEICRARGCTGVAFTKIILAVVARGAARDPRLRRRSAEIIADDLDGGPRWRVTKVLGACRKAKGLKVPSAKAPEGFPLHETLKEEEIARALAADGIVPYISGGGRTNSLQYALGLPVRIHDPERLVEVLELCGLAERGGGICPLPASRVWGATIKHTEAAILSERRRPAATDDEYAAVEALSRA